MELFQTLREIQWASFDILPLRDSTGRPRQQPNAKAQSHPRESGHCGCADDVDSVSYVHVHVQQHRFLNLVQRLDVRQRLGHRAARVIGIREGLPTWNDDRHFVETGLTDNYAAA